MNKKLIAILFSTMLLLSACGGGGATENEASDTATTGGTEVTAAEGIYQKSCAGCHGGNLQGNMGPQLSKVGSKYTEEEILNIIHNGQGSMPKGVIQGADAEAVAKWLAEKK